MTPDRGLTGPPEELTITKPTIPTMKKFHSNSMAVSLLLAGLASAARVHAQALTEVTVSGGNASSSLLFYQVTNQFQGVTTVGATSSSTVRSFQGYLPSLPGSSPNVQIDFILNGAVGGLQDITYQNVETNALGVATNVPVLVVSSTTPEAVGLSSAPFTEVKTLVAPYLFIKSPVAGLNPGLATVTNLTQREAAYLEGSAGTNFHSAFIGGTSTNDAVYFVGRNTASAVRTETDANIYFTGTLATYTTNSSGLPILDPAGGQTSGSAIRILLNTIPNTIGTVAVQDLKTNLALSFEGVPYSVRNVETGSYPLWGYEHWYWLSSGQGAPTPAQLAVVNNLLAGITNVTFQTSNPLFTNSFVPYSGLQVQRAVDGGPITWQ
jgi:hypothetical protein